MRELDDREARKAKIRALCPHTPLVSDRVGETIGTYAGIDSRGTVWLITWHQPRVDDQGQVVVVRTRKVAPGQSDAPEPRWGRRGSLDD